MIFLPPMNGMSTVVIEVATSRNFYRKDFLLFCPKNETYGEVMPIKGTFVLTGLSEVPSKEKPGDVQKK